MILSLLVVAQPVPVVDFYAQAPKHTDSWTLIGETKPHIAIKFFQASHTFRKEGTRLFLGKNMFVFRSVSSHDLFWKREQKAGAGKLVKACGVPHGDRLRRSTESHRRLLKVRQLFSGTERAPVGFRQLCGLRLLQDLDGNDRHREEGVDG